MWLYVWIVNSFLSLNSIPLYGYTTTSLSIHLLMDISVVYNFWLLHIMSPWTFVYKSLYVHISPFILSKYLGVEWLHQILGVCLTIYETAKLSKWLYYFMCPPAVYESYSSFVSLSKYVVVSLLNFSHSSGHVIMSPYGFNLHFPND